jgi:hypothetical protein
MAAKKPAQPFKVGDRVKVRFSDWSGRIIEEWGALGPGGMLAYRVRIPRKPKPIYIDLTEDQLIAIPPAPKTTPVPSARRRTGNEPTTGTGDA